MRDGSCASKFAGVSDEWCLSNCVAGGVCPERLCACTHDGAVEYMPYAAYGQKLEPYIAMLAG